MLQKVSLNNPEISKRYKPLRRKIELLKAKAINKAKSLLA